MKSRPDLSTGGSSQETDRLLPYEVLMYQAKREYAALLAREQADQTRKSRRSKKGGLRPLSFDEE